MWVQCFAVTDHKLTPRFNKDSIKTNNNAVVEEYFDLRIQGNSIYRWDSLFLAPSLPLLLLPLAPVWTRVAAVPALVPLLLLRLAPAILLLLRHRHILQTYTILSGQ